MRVLAVDPGEKRHGIAISDQSGTIANPLTIIKHSSREKDAAAVLNLALERDAKIIVIGMTTDAEGNPSLMGRKAVRLAASIRKQTEIPVVLWDESESTKTALAAKKTSTSLKKKRSPLDDLAATVILQSYLDAQRNKKEDRQLP